MRCITYMAVPFKKPCIQLYLSDSPAPRSKKLSMLFALFLIILVKKTQNFSQNSIPLPVPDRGTPSLPCHILDSSELIMHLRAKQQRPTCVNISLQTRPPRAPFSSTLPHSSWLGLVLRLRLAWGLGSFFGHAWDGCSQRRLCIQQSLRLSNRWEPECAFLPETTPHHNGGSSCHNVL